MGISAGAQRGVFRNEMNGIRFRSRAIHRLRAASFRISHGALGFLMRPSMPLARQSTHCSGAQRACPSAAPLSRTNPRCDTTYWPAKGVPEAPLAASACDRRRNGASSLPTLLSQVGEYGRGDGLCLQLRLTSVLATEPVRDEGRVTAACVKYCEAVLAKVVAIPAVAPAATVRPRHFRPTKVWVLAHLNAPNWCAAVMPPPASPAMKLHIMQNSRAMGPISAPASAKRARKNTVITSAPTNMPTMPKAMGFTSPPWPRFRCSRAPWRRSQYSRQPSHFRTQRVWLCGPVCRQPTSRHAQGPHNKSCPSNPQTSPTQVTSHSRPLPRASYVVKCKDAVGTAPVPPRTLLIGTLACVKVRAGPPEAIRLHARLGPTPLAPAAPRRPHACNPKSRCAMAACHSASSPGPRCCATTRRAHS